MGRWSNELQFIDLLNAPCKEANWPSAASTEDADIITDAHNADCDAYEARIAELEEMIHQQAKRCMSWRRCFDLAFRLKNRYYDENVTLRAELARVRAESLRVVPVGEACRICDADEGVILVGGNVYQITDHSEWIGMAEGVRYLHQEIPEYDDDTIVQPVRLERWEDEG